ncbi:SIMPL domain-containing protein [Paracoccus aminophilus]|uniref:DUF541 domain-containing protein n=1 Tax=Paracoccus aminophilus JCM 7686 TaxID=1367847 RepID=S5XS55_PARAH|nr:SIMPL domain-containing protein [Paracoccus aminophilus]AGT07952.1 hypothetical protein JCM7686_0843 [Paracoccus aminophilus JCM 7686]
MERRPTLSRAADRSLSRRFAAGLAAGATALTLVASSLPALAQATPGETPPPPHHAGKMEGQHPAMVSRLTVSGEGTSSAQPDMASISIGVTVQADTAAAAMSENASRQQAVIAKLKEIGVDAKDIQTSGLNLSPVQTYTNDGKPPVVTGYMAQNMVQVRVRDLAKLGPALDTLVMAGANEINGISFSREDTLEAEDQARVKAIENARHKAEVMANATGMKLGRLISLSDVTMGSGPRPIMMAMNANAKAADTPIEAGELGVTANVTATFALVPAHGPAGGADGAEDAGAEAPAAE